MSDAIDVNPYTLETKSIDLATDAQSIDDAVAAWQESTALLFEKWQGAAADAYRDNQAQVVMKLLAKAVHMRDAATALHTAAVAYDLADRDGARALGAIDDRPASVVPLAGGYDA